MASEIQLKPTPSLVKRYQELLVEEWSAEIVPKLVDFLERQLGLSKLKIGFLWQGKKRGRVDPQIGLSGEIKRRISVLQRVHFRLLRSVPSKWTPGDSDKPGDGQLAFRASILMLLQLLVNVEGEFGLFQDTQSLLFLNCAYFLLPRLASAGLDDAHNNLVHAMATHATVVWVDDASHQQYLLSVLANYLKDDELEERTLRDSFLLTSQDDHEYLTKAQCLWQFYLDHGRPDDASALLLQAYRTASKEHLFELREMIGETFAEMCEQGKIGFASEQ